MSLQERVLGGTLSAITARKPAQAVMNAGLYAGFAVALYVLIDGTVDLFAALACLGVGVLYSLSRDGFTHRHIKAALASHLAYVKSKHPQMELYVPMVEVAGRTVLLKRSGLFFEDGELALEAFNQPVFAKRPKDSITVPCGVDFKIYETVVGDKTPFVLFHSELMKNQYRFQVFKDDEVIARIKAFAEVRQAAATPATGAPIERND